MKRFHFFTLSLAFAGVALVAAAQNPPTQQAEPPSGISNRPAPAPALSGLAGMQTDAVVEDPGSDLPLIPALLGGRGSSLSFPEELRRTNYFRGGLGVGAAYDDNALLAQTGARSNTGYSVYPALAIEQTWPRMRWSLAYAGGLTVNQELSNRNQGAHAVTFDSQYRLSPHVNLRIAEDFAQTTGFFDGGSGTAGGGTSGPNASLITPLATERTNLTTVEGNYHFLLNDVVGASGSFYDLRFTNAPAGSALANTQTEAGAGFWLHRIFRRNWAGTSYRFERITFDPTDGESRVHSFFLIDTMGGTRGFTFSAFVGPQYSDNRGLTPASDAVVEFQQWFMAGGAEVGWRSERTTLATGYARRIADGGGVLGAVRMQSVYGDIRRELYPGWAVRLGGSYGSNHSLTVPFRGTGSKFYLTSASVSLERNIGRSLGLRLGYGHDFQHEAGFVDPTQKLDAHRNRVFVTLTYQWAKPLGI